MASPGFESHSSLTVFFFFSCLISAPAHLTYITGIANCLTCPLGTIFSQPLMQLTGNMGQLSLCIWQVTRITTSKHNLHLKSVHKVCSFFFVFFFEQYPVFFLVISFFLQFLDVLHQQRNFWSLLNGSTDQDRGMEEQIDGRAEGMGEEQKGGRMDGEETREGGR